ncbi:SCY1 protein kinase [Microbotryum lychnidis-dioicae p1A1 Lamole]|uniref:SCY1 protein kinase n=1 Tax=Microbotryum lychnidis-dioicae (strain p1A1 Lamole / MvSl-1064) TaxID=683840 RepID=U5H8G5_USTV1|nr:SCY1 protein kinase [Microbotryum lychnidis-dioicae p1A1 Lamole]|eukprot:KDE06107.1 SCY1 protein kinase [Microbotryum lychnidis-dioicae p1A1 Lamole]
MLLMISWLSPSLFLSVGVHVAACHATTVFEQRRSDQAAFATMEYASAFLSAASSLGARSALSSNYTLATATSPSSSSSSSATAAGAISSSSSSAPIRTLQIGPWKVERASHNSSGKQVSIWSCDKSSLVAPTGALKRDPNAARTLEKAVETLKKEAASLSRLRHPCILEMAEPIEETRSVITFATEPVTASLRQAIAASASTSSAAGSISRGSDRRNGSSSSSAAVQQQSDLELDEVEIQKGLSQLAKGLHFLHESAKTIHGNLTPEAVVINAKGDWKLSGFGLSIPLFGPDGVATKWEFPAYDHGLPATIQRNYDYIAPEYILDEANPTPANDMYSLGCILHSIHTHAGPPFQNRQSLSNARTNIEEGLSRGMVRPQWRRLTEEAQSALGQLVTRYPNQRISAAAFLAHGYFSSLLVSTLNFIARDAFASQSTEAQTGFLKGLLIVLPQFSDKVNRRKVLPSLLEETNKTHLIPFLLPNIAYIGQRMDVDAFRSQVLPHLIPLFKIKDPPQAILALLDSLPLFSEKSTPTSFREEVMPLVYYSLESDNPVVLEKALKEVPSLCETLDYTTVKQTLFPKITTVFTKTTMLSVKVNTLICFHSMTSTLDKFTITERLVPLLAKIKTKEPAVMLATLEVCSKIGDKVDLEALASQILPQLWRWSMGPLLSADQFAKFMSVIKRIGHRVETEHTKALQEQKRLEESTSGGSLSRGGGGAGSTPMDFEALVRGGAGLGRATEVAADIFGDDSPGSVTTSHGFTPPPNGVASFAPSRPSPRSSLSHSSLGAKPVPASTLISSAFGAPTASMTPTTSSLSSMTLVSPPPPPAASSAFASSSSNSMSSFTSLEPTRSSLSSLPSLPNQTNNSTTSSYSSPRPNYHSLTATTTTTNTLPPLVPNSSSFSPPNPNPWASSTPSQPSMSMSYVAPAPPSTPAPKQWDVLQPKVVTQPRKPSNGDFGAWSDFDPLK